MTATQILYKVKCPEINVLAFAEKIGYRLSSLNCPDFNPH